MHTWMPCLTVYACRCTAVESPSQLDLHGEPSTTAQPILLSQHDSLLSLLFHTAGLGNSHPSSNGSMLGMQAHSSSNSSLFPASLESLQKVGKADNNAGALSTSLSADGSVDGGISCVALTASGTPWNPQQHELEPSEVLKSYGLSSWFPYTDPLGHPYDPHHTSDLPHMDDPHQMQDTLHRFALPAANAAHATGAECNGLKGANSWAVQPTDSLQLGEWLGMAAASEAQSMRTPLRPLPPQYAVGRSSASMGGSGGGAQAGGLNMRRGRQGAVHRMNGPGEREPLGFLQVGSWRCMLSSWEHRAGAAYAYV